MGGPGEAKRVPGKKLPSFEPPVPPARMADLRKRLTNLETAFRQLRNSPADWPNKQQQLGQLGRYVGDLHGDLRTATSANAAWWSKAQVVMDAWAKSHITEIKFDPATAKIIMTIRQNVQELQDLGRQNRFNPSERYKPTI